MKKFKDRLEEIKKVTEPQLESRMIFLLDPKDVKTLEAVSAWEASNSRPIEKNVRDNATLEDLWEIAEPDFNEFAEVLNVKLVSAMARYRQLRKLGIIYPDGSVAKLASQLVSLYIRMQAAMMEDKIRKSKKGS